MTLINLTVLADALGTAAPIDAVLEAEATSARTAGAEARTPQKIVVPITAGAPTAPLNLEGTGVGWCWKLVLMVPATGYRITRFVQVPASGTVTWEDLVDVNPLTLKVLPDAVPAWKAAMDELLAARDAAVLAVTDAVTVQVDAQVTPKVTAAQTARTGAETARDTAEDYRDETEQRYVLLGDVTGSLDLATAIGGAPAGLDMRLTGDVVLTLPSLGDRVLTCSIYARQDATGGRTLTITGALASWAVPITLTPTANAHDLIHLIHYGPRGWVQLFGAQNMGIPAGGGV